MVTKREPLITEISEDAYKQNSVYRPWEEIRASGAAKNADTSLTPQQALRAIASSVSVGLIDSGVSG